MATEKILQVLVKAIRVTARERGQDEVELAREVIQALLDLTEPRTKVKVKKKEGAK